MAKIYIDGKEYEVDASQNLLHVALSLKLDLPYFCWHPAMGSVGACRQCAVIQYRDENDQTGKLIMACMTPAADGTRISIDDPQAKDFRDSITEWLMLNHPHDCPVCDEGGECHLQDMTLMTGHVYRRKRFKKRTFRNQYLGPLVNHEMNRCIECYRCVRYYQGIAGGRDLDVFAAHDHVYFGRQEEGVLESEFSGNLVEVCPTGVFTDKTYRFHYARKWDLQTAPSVCVHCSLGCNTIPGERYGSLRRIRNRYNADVNGYFLCDRGRYGYEFVNSQQRIRQPQVKSLHPPNRQPATAEETASHLEELLPSGAPLIGIGSPRATLEANFALQALVGKQNFFAGISADEARLEQRILSILREGPVPPASLQEAADADAALVLGEDLTNTAPMLALSLRQTVRNQPSQEATKKNIDLWNDSAIREIVQDQKGPLYISTPAATRLDDAATATAHLAPDGIAALGFAVANLLDSASPRVKDLPDELETQAKEIVQKLNDAQRPVVVSGTSLGSEAVIQAAAAVAWALKAAGKDVRLTYIFPESNSMGLALLEDKSLQGALQALQEVPGATLIVLENDLYRRVGEQLVDELFQAAGHVIVLDSIETETTAKADLVLPAATYAESDGTLVNNEGRAQRFFQVFVPEGDIRASWRWTSEMMDLVGHELSGQWHNLDDVLQALGSQLPLFAPVLEIAPPEEFRLVGQKVPRQPPRYSGRTAMQAHIDVSEQKPPPDPDAPLAFSMEGYKGKPPPSLIPRFWAPGWNSIQSLHKFQQEVDGLLMGGDNPGRRLIEPAADSAVTYFREFPGLFAVREREYLAIPLYHIFGSEELSSLSPAIDELAPEPYLALNPALAESLGIGEAEPVQLDVLGRSLRLPARLVESLSADMVGLPAGLPGIPAGLPALSRIRRDTGDGEAGQP
jgi:NADH-quinone oxidoreductase subunit G